MADMLTSNNGVYRFQGSMTVAAQYTGFDWQGRDRTRIEQV